MYKRQYDNKRNLGLIGMHGSIAANRAVDRADLIIALGARFSDRVALNPEKFGKKAHKIQVDIDTSEINKNVLVDVGISADKMCIRDRFWSMSSRLIRSQLCSFCAK